MPIQLGGIISGVDTDDVIQKLMEVDARNKKTLETRKTNIESIKDLFGTFQTKLLTLKGESDTLQLSSTFQKRSTASTDTSVVTATAADGATPGTYAILVDRLATQSTNQSTAGVNTNISRRSTIAVSPGTSPVDLTKSFADNISAGLLPSTLDTSTTVTVTTDAASRTTAALSTFSTVQAFIDDINANLASANFYYDSTNDRFVVERKNNAGAGSLSLANSAPGAGLVGFWSAANIATGAAASNESGLNSSATLAALNTDTAITSGTGSFKINGTSITYDTASDTLQNLIDRINNSSATTGVVAFYDQSLDRVVLQRTAEGPHSITIDTSGGIDARGVISSLKLTGATSTGVQSVFSINGNTITADTNSYTFNGITLSLKKQAAVPNGVPESTDASASVSVTQDSASVSTAIKDFVTAYNDVVQFYVDNASYDAATRAAGKLFGDSLVNNIDSRLRRLLFQSQPALTDTHELLAQLGIELGDFNTPDENKLIVDDSKLSSAIASNATAVEQLFGRSTTGGTVKTAGIAVDITNYIKDLTKSGGIVDLKEDVLTDRIDDIDERIAREDERLARMEASLRRQFNDMETALATLNAEGSSIVAQLSRL